MGGSLGDVAPGQPGESAAAADDPTAAKKARGKASKAMDVKDFLAQGNAGAQLPRQQQGKKDREKSKRMLGQSSHSVWKSEAEMVLRQQFDS